MRDRGSVVIIENEKVVLIQRVRNGSVYYVFPGGGIENNENPREAAKREAFEELGVEVDVKELFVKIEFNGTQYYFLSDINKGTVGTGQGEEYTDTKRERGTYSPKWVDMKELPLLDVRPKEVAEKIYFNYLNMQTNLL